MMHLTILEKNVDSIEFVLDGVNAAFANTLRRIVLAEVPSMAIDDVLFIENSSVIHDEILASRLGLIPLNTDLDSYSLPEKCSCKSELGCNLCRTILTLDKESLDEVTTVYSGDLVSEDPKITPINDNIPIVKLAPKQKLKLESYARLGKGMVHAKWQPVSSCIYRNMPKVEMLSNSCGSCRDCVKVCPKQVFEKEGDKVRVAKPNACILCGDCIESCKETPSHIKISSDPNSFIFYVESLGTIPIERILFEAISIHQSKFNDFLNSISVITSEP